VCRQYLRILHEGENTCATQAGWHQLTQLDRIKLNCQDVLKRLCNLKPFENKERFAALAEK
jgi:hypothetical protein